MNDALLTDTDIEEAYSLAYAHAVAASAGYVVSLKGHDRDGIDMTIEAGDLQRPKLDLQLKATINLGRSGDTFSYFCKKRNYDLLRIESQTPRILVVLHLPREKPNWLNLSAESLIMRNCAYWICLTGEPESANDTGETVYLPTSNKFDTEGLQELMRRSRTGSLK